MLFSLSSPLVIRSKVTRTCVAGLFEGSVTRRRKCHDIDWGWGCWEDEEKWFSQVLQGPREVRFDLGRKRKNVGSEECQVISLGVPWTCRKCQALPICGFSFPDVTRETSSLCSTVRLANRTAPGALWDGLFVPVRTLLSPWKCHFTKPIPFLVSSVLKLGASPVTQQLRIRLQCRSHKRRRFDPWVGKMPWMRTWQPTTVFLPVEYHGSRSLVGCSTQDCKESDMTEVT